MQLLTQELQQKARGIKAAAPLVLVCILLFIMAYLLLTLALVSVIATWFQPNPYRWFFAFILVGIVWVVVGSVAGALAWHGLSKSGLLPKKTIEVLKADKDWLEQEVKKANEHSTDSHIRGGGVRAA